MDYYTELYSDYKNITSEWFYKYYNEAYKDLMKLCNRFLDDEYQLNIPFENACKLYNHMSSRDFDRFLKLDTDLTKELVDLRINYINIKLDSIMKKIFNPK